MPCRSAFALAILFACGDAEPSPAPEGAEATSPAAETPPAPEAQPQAEGREGTLSFRLDGEERTMRFFPNGGNAAFGPTVNIQGLPMEGSDEEFQISIAFFRLGEATLPLEVTTEDAAAARREGHMARTVLYTYRPAGEFYAARASVVLDSFEGGFLSGHMDEVRLPGGDISPGKEVTITDLRFRIRLE